MLLGRPWIHTIEIKTGENNLETILQTLRKEFETFEIKTGENITEYFAKVMIIANKMRIYGEEMRDVTIMEKILRSLTDKFNYIICSIKESKDITVLLIDELQSSLIVYEQKFQKSSGEEEALKVTSKYRIYGRGQGKKVLRREGRGRGRYAFNKTTIECYRYHKLGHFQYECPTKNNEVNYAVLDNEEEIFLMSHVEL
jgi:RNase H-fold protein (predicted Holliday junction resolvase)